MTSDYARLLEISMREFERSVVPQVELAFAALPDEVCKVPFIDEKYDPHAPPEQHTEQKQRVIRALCARKMFEFESPRRCQPLPLCEAERARFYGSGDHRLSITAQYAARLESMDWHFERATPFFDFILQCAPR